MTTWRLPLSLFLLLCICFIAPASFASQPNGLFNQLKAYADLANAAYLSEQEAQTIIESQAYQLDQFSRVPGVEISYFIASNSMLKRHVIAIRGTANVENAIVDISLKLQPNKHTKIALHQGFAQAAEGVYEAILPRLNKYYEISITGHSLGGAVAVILAMYLDMDNYTLGPVITFGQPKVTNVRGAVAFRHLDIHRVVTAQDIVPLIPPLDMMDIRNLDIYWHLGKEIVLLDGNDYATLEGVKSMMRATRIINTTLSQENLEHHKMSHYLELIGKKNEAANLVPYETGIDLLKLFN